MYSDRKELLQSYVMIFNENRHMSVLKIEYRRTEEERNYIRNSIQMFLQENGDVAPRWEPLTVNQAPQAK